MTRVPSQLPISVNNRIGIVLPSSNTVVEPLAGRMLQSTGVSAHFSRLGVFNVALDQESKAQFELQSHVNAAALLADAKVDAIVWAGTSASWLGSSHDQVFCDSVLDKTGIPTTSCVLSMNVLLQDSMNGTFGLVTPYTQDVHNHIIANYTNLGFECTSSENLGGSISNEFASISEQIIEDSVRRVAVSQPDMIFIMCTNLHGAAVARSLSIELEIPVIDSAAASISAALSLLRENRS